MKYYDYEDLGIVSAKKPFNTHLWWEHSTYGLFLVDSTSQDKLLYSTDKGDNWTDIDLTGATSKKIQGGWLETNDLWLVTCDNGPSGNFTVIYVELDNSNNVVDVGDSAGADANSTSAYDIFNRTGGMCVVNHEVRAGTDTMVAWDVDAAPFVEIANFQGPDVDAAPTQCMYAIPDGANFYMPIDMSGAVFLLALSSGILAYKGTEATAYSITTQNLRGVAYDGSTYAYYVLNKDGDGLNYLMRFNIASPATTTELGRIDVAMMNDRNVDGTVPPFTLEKGFHLSAYEVYQLRPKRDGWVKIEEPASDAALIAITDTYLMNNDGDMFEYVDVTNTVASKCLINFKMGNVTNAEFSVTDNLDVLEHVEFIDNNGLLVFDGVITEKTYTETEFYDYMAIGRDMEIITYKVTYDATGAVNAKTAIEAILDSANWLYYSSSITDPVINITADFQNLPFKDVMDTIADKCDYVWYVAPDGKVFFNDGTTASGISVSESSGIYGEPKFKVMGSQINKVTIYGGYVNGTRLTSTDEDTASQLINGVQEYIDHFPHITDQTELDALSAAIRGRSGMATNPYYIDVPISGQGFIQCGNTINLTFTPLSYAASNDILLSYQYDAIQDSGIYKLSTGIVHNQWRGYGILGQKTKAADEEQLDILAGNLLGLDALTDPGADRILFWDDSETLLGDR
jgi:hypothetical protein